MEAVTVEQLANMCNNLVRGGKGKKKIMISSDDEGNEYHELFFGFTEDASSLFDGECPPLMPCGVTKENIKNYIVLG